MFHLKLHYYIVLLNELFISLIYRQNCCSVMYIAIWILNYQHREKNIFTVQPPLTVYLVCMGTKLIESHLRLGKKTHYKDLGPKCGVEFPFELLTSTQHQINRPQMHKI